jgi:CRP-like cAMP-binding protein
MAVNRSIENSNRVSAGNGGTRFPFVWKDDPIAILRDPSAGSTVHRVKKREVIFQQAMPADAVFYLLKGRVKLTAVSSEGREATVALLQPGDFLGEESLDMKARLRTTTAIALSECTVLKTERKAMARMLERDQQLFNYFLSFLLGRNIRMQEDLVDRLFHTSEQRLARVLLLLSGLDRSDQLEAIIPKVSQETLAEIIGSTRSRVSLFMNGFRKRGLIDYDGDYTGQLRVRKSLKQLLSSR